ncbi:MAG: nucleotidyltransferase domain-containing protein [Lentisphaerae bacterium]|nr:nucleotidyltransferase domain-containing protein [Lentisphaerota bacterium]
MIDTSHPEEAETIIKEAVRRLCQSMATERIYLFGSRARGEADNNSDYDFLVVIHDSPLPRYKRAQQAYKSLWGLRVAKDVLVFTRKEFDEGLAVVSSLPATVAREGKLLYGR